MFFPFTIVFRIQIEVFHLLYSFDKVSKLECEIQDKGIETFQRSVPGRPIRQVFFFDPDGKLL